MNAEERLAMIRLAATKHAVQETTADSVCDCCKNTLEVFGELDRLREQLDSTREALEAAEETSS